MSKNPRKNLNKETDPTGDPIRAHCVRGLDLDTDCFSHGQLYVVCSRVGKPDNLYICTDNGTTKNIVYPQAGSYLCMDQRGLWPGMVIFGGQQIFRTRIFIVSFYDLSIDTYDTVVVGQWHWGLVDLYNFPPGFPI